MRWLTDGTYASDNNPAPPSPSPFLHKYAPGVVSKTKSKSASRRICHCQRSLPLLDSPRGMYDTRTQRAHREERRVGEHRPICRA
uniref:Uncharacterized protein n=1 Tax=Mycena chlorophos TaxID=658473 RepID=A0ABQ0LH50_MYCCL|nr:predicted protein [Mycena chlorophos]